MVEVRIVGGAGYVGGWLTDEAILAGHHVPVLANLTKGDAYLRPVGFAYEV